jgi:hypothetical protein
MEDGTPIYKLSPSDFAYLWEECRRCFWLKVKHGIWRPRSPFPGVFNVIDGAMKRALHGRRIEELVPGVKPGIINCEDMTEAVQSLPIQPVGCEAAAFIAGKIDTEVHFDDGTYGILDFKTTVPRNDTGPRYSRQLHGYCAAIENPAHGEKRKISALGLVCFAPELYEQRELVLQESADRIGASLLGSVSWIPVMQDREGFNTFIRMVLMCLQDADPPAAGARCDYCAYPAKRTDLVVTS